MNMEPDRSRAALLRDAALERIRRTRRWMIIGTAALTAGIAALVSAVAPGRSFAAKSSHSQVASTAGSTAAASSAIPSMPAPASSSELGLQGPDQAPSSSPSPSQSQPSQPSQPLQPAPQPQPSSGGGGGGGGPVVSGGS